MITVKRCAPPLPNCQPGPWCEYQVRTDSGLNEVRGFAPGTLAQATAVARKALADLNRMEGPSCALSAFIVNAPKLAKYVERHGRVLGNRCNCEQCKGDRKARKQRTRELQQSQLSVPACR